MTEWMIQTVIITIIGVIAFFIKNYKAALDQTDDKLQQEIYALQDEMNQYKLEVADKYVQKDDFIRASANTDRKLDRIYDELMKINTH